MAIDKNILKLAAVMAVGSVAKRLFEEPTPITKNYYESPDQDVKGNSEDEN